jgi:hypothetical protein
MRLWLGLFTRPASEVKRPGTLYEAQAGGTMVLTTHSRPIHPHKPPPGGPASL